MRMIKLAAAAALASMAMACANAGNQALKEETGATVAQKLEVGMTQPEVRGIYGEPNTTSFTDGGNIIWKYEFVEAQAKAENFIPVVNLFASGARGHKKELTILFDENDLLKKHSMTVSPVETNTGLLSQ